MISKRAQEIPPFLVMDILERAQKLEKQGHDIIHLEIGEPDFPTPKKIKDAAKRAIERGETHYTHSLGISPLREAVAKSYYNKYGVSVSPDQVIITMGTSPALLLILTCLLNPGDEVILSDPCYACYPNFIRFIQGIPVSVPVYAEDHFAYRPDLLKRNLSQRTKAIMINSPSNPTGTLLSREHMQTIADLGHYIISDEIYHGLVYEEKEHSILEFTDNAFVINGFSKYYAMTGWRLGYIIAPPEFVRPIQKVQQNLFICASSVSQWAGVSALTEEHAELKEMVDIYNQRRLYLIKALREIGFDIAVEPKGAFYVLADARQFCTDSYKFCLELLEKTHVATTAGVDFGGNAEGFLRFSYANSLDNIKGGVERLQGFIEKN